MNAPDANPLDPAFEKAIRDHLPPEAVALVAAFLQMTEMYEPQSELQQRAMQQVERFAEGLIDLLGAEEFSRLLEELGM